MVNRTEDVTAGMGRNDGCVKTGAVRWSVAVVCEKSPGYPAPLVWQGGRKRRFDALVSEDMCRWRCGSSPVFDGLRRQGVACEFLPHFADGFPLAVLHGEFGSMGRHGAAAGHSGHFIEFGFFFFPAAVCLIFFVDDMVDERFQAQDQSVFLAVAFFADAVELRGKIIEKFAMVRIDFHTRQQCGDFRCQILPVFERQPGEPFVETVVRCGHEMSSGIGRVERETGICRHVRHDTGKNG